MLQLGEGVSGIVRQIGFLPWIYYIDWSSDADDDNNPRNWSLRIWTDCGDLDIDDDLPDPTVEIPIASVLGAWFDIDRFEVDPETGRPKSLPPVIETDYFAANVGRTKPGAGLDTIHMFDFYLGYPQPFTNGILILLGRRTNDGWVPFGDPDDLFWFEVQYELGDLPDTPFKNLRLKSSRYDGATDGHDPVFVEEGSGQGCACALWLAAISGDLSWEETGVAFQTDGDWEHDSWMSSGVDGMFGVQGGGYFIGGTYIDRQAGCMYEKAETGEAPIRSLEAYRCFNTSSIYWSDGLRGRWPRGFEPGSYSDWTESHVVFLYYHGEVVDQQEHQ
jgi:hypothetical protein